MIKLIYLTVTRQDISFFVSQISRSMYTPRTPYLDVINRILRYLKGTPEKEIWRRNNNFNKKYGYYDTDWAGCFD
jgi:hypothetical protein